MKKSLTMLVLPSLVCIGVEAQEATGDQNELRVETVPVIGRETKQETSFTSLPLATSVIDQTQLKDIKLQQPIELLQRISGISMARNIRIPISDKSYTVAQVDGLALGSPYSSSMSDIRDINPRNIERIEVVKGLGSAIHSSNAFGGTINVITKQPSEEHERYLDIEQGNYDRTRLGFQASGQFGQHGYFFDASRQRMKGYRDEYRDEADQVSGKGFFQLSGSNHLTLGAEMINRSERFPGELTEEEYQQDTKQVGDSLGSNEEVESRMIILSDTHQFNEQSQLQFSSVYLREKAEGINYNTGPTDSVRDDSESKLTYRHQFAPLQGQLLMGASYIYGRSDFTRYIARNGQINWQDPMSDSISHTNIEALFAEYSLTPVSPLELRFGVRRENVVLDTYNKLNNEEFEANFASTDPRLGAVWSISDQHRIWLSYSEGFFAPNTRQLYSDITANPDLKPERLTSHEFGFSGHWEQQLHYSLSYYESDIEDFIVVENFVDEDRQPYRRYSNAGLVETSGIELDFSYQITPWLAAAAAYTHSDNRYGQYINAYTRQDLSGNTLSRSPDHHLNLRLAVTPIEGLKVEFEWDAISEYYTSDDNDADPAGAFERDGILHVRASYDMGNISLWLHGLNLTDTLEDDVLYSRGERYYEITNDTVIYAGVSFQF
ncbi:TonB-dependent receptor [Teredinibacter sp. KSP-S5-2]|uniref:TonB-dependent receptor n=1 Tax=Teredinibacter sp. KSP-S5-2 TaxID=3034506 RepID=UPI0029345C8E|nr:TonB-dependent receptor [Teredinibacter sp. KSP-S5-2]WNO08902.1 TonB-dependent receptor [Teredinibacter sp. KSP-S5-2]